MKAKFFFLLMVPAFLLFFININAQVPQGFNYQAIARDGSGNPITGTTIKVKLSVLSDTLGFKATGAGVYVWEEEHTNIKTNAFGLFTVTLGTGTQVAGSAPSFSSINWNVAQLFIGTKIANPSTYKIMGSARLWSVPYSMSSGSLSGPVTKLAVNGNTPLYDEALFEVKNKDGQTVFAVYNEGVRIYVDNGAAKAGRGGFAVGGFDRTKAVSDTYFIVSPDSIRAYIGPTTAKPSRGGFAVGGFDRTKAITEEYLRITRDSARIYLADPVKGSRGGFAVGGFDRTKGQVVENYLNLTPENYLIGHQAGKNLTIGGMYNSFIGYMSGFRTTTGSYNNFIGYYSGYNNITGNNNVTLGYLTGYSNTTGYNNVFVGRQAGFSNSEGYGNTFIGNTAGVSNTTGIWNIFFGENAGGANTIGSRNVFIGQYSGRNNTEGGFNVFIGQQTGEANTTGNFNLFAGRSAGSFNTTGILNTFLGTNSGNANTNGNENLCVGGESGKWNNTGSYNVNVGTGAGFSNTDGNFNIMLGYYTGVNLSSGSSNIFIGQYAGGGLSNATNKLFIENSGANENNALIYGDFGADFLRFNANTEIRNSLSFPNGGAVLWVSGKEALWFNGAYYSWGFGGDYNYFARPVTIAAASNPGTYKLYVAGNVGVTGTVTNPSDSRYKINVEEIVNVLDKIENVRSITYNWDSGKFPEMKLDDSRQLGFIAQEVEPWFPELVTTNVDGYKSLDYSRMSVILLQAVKEQNLIIKSQQKQMDEWSNELEQLKVELSQIKALLSTTREN